MRGRGWPRKRQTWKAYASFFKLQELYCVSFILFQHAFLRTPSSVLSFRGNLKTTPIRLRKPNDRMVALVYGKDPEFWRVSIADILIDN